MGLCSGSHTCRGSRHGGTAIIRQDGDMRERQQERGDHFQHPSDAEAAIHPQALRTAMKLGPVNSIEAKIMADYELHLHRVMEAPWLLLTIGHSNRFRCVPRALVEVRPTRMEHLFFRSRGSYIPVWRAELVHPHPDLDGVVECYIPGIRDYDHLTGQVMDEVPYQIRFELGSPWKRFIRRLIGLFRFSSSKPAIQDVDDDQDRIYNYKCPRCSEQWQAPYWVSVTCPNCALKKVPPLPE
jgi:hypothetical protein